MKIKSVLISLLLISPLVAANDTAVLLKPASGGQQKALIGKMGVTADAITFDAAHHQLHCEGNVTLRLDGRIVKSQDCTIELADRSTFYRLDANGVKIDAPAPTSKPAGS